MKKINQKEMFDGLMHLVNSEDAFYKVDSEMSGVKYRVFNYRIPSWTQMNLPFAKECRGSMFDITDEQNPRLVCLTPQKFFNYKEGQPKEHEKHKLGVKMKKMDGSLLSTFEHNGKLFFKSKTSIASSQVKEALELMYADKGLLQEATSLQKEGWTLNFEYISPKNTIVVPYTESALVLLSIRSLDDGQVLYADKLEKKLKNEGLGNLLNACVEYTMVSEDEQNQKSLIEKIGKETDGEGYVIEVLAPEPYLVKVKNDAYSCLHQFLEKIESNHHLVKVILHEKADDARSLFRDNPEILERIETLEKKVLPIYNAIQKNIDDFVSANKDMEKKEYVMKAQEDDKSSGFSFPLAPFKIQKLKDINTVPKFCMDNVGKVFGVSDAPIQNAVKVEEGGVTSTKPKPKPKM